MTPYYQDDAVTIYHGDCREILPSIVTADILLTDVPYNVVNRDDEGLRSLDRGTADSAPVEVAWLAEQAGRVVTGSSYIWCATEQVSDLRRGLVDAGFSTRTCVWHKSNPSPMNGERMWLSAIELCVFGRKAKAHFVPRCQPPVWCGPSEPRTDHPTAKPEWLFGRLLAASAPPKGLVLDPFMGSGTTARAAKDHGLRAIGIELEERYCEIAARRCAQEVLAL